MARSRRRGSRKQSRRLKKRQGNVTGFNPNKRLKTADIRGFMNRLGGQAAIQHMGLGAGSQTTTTQKSQSDAWEFGDQGIKYKTLNISYKASKIGRLTNKLSAPGAVYETVATGAFGPAGKQWVTNISNVWGLTTAVPGTARLNELFESLQETTVTVPLPIGGYSRKMMFNSATYELELNNVGPTTSEFQLYFCIDKCTSASTFQPDIVWDSAVSNETGPVALVPSEAKQTMWTQPKTFKQFNITYWTKSIKGALTPGERCKITINFKPRRLLDTSYIANFQAIRGITHSLMLVQRGVICDVTNDKSLAAGQTTSETKLVWLLKRTLRGSILQTLPRLNKQTGSVLPIGPAALWVVDEDTGEPENVFVPAEFA